MPVTLEFQELDKLDTMFQRMPQTIVTGVKCAEEAADHCLVWEWGSTRITQPGPKTTWGVNPDGEVVILTKTAPTGFIRLNGPTFRANVETALQEIDLSAVPVDHWEAVIGTALLKAAEQNALLIKEAAPYDTGTLRTSISAIGADDPILAGTENAYGRTELNIKL